MIISFCITFLQILSRVMRHTKSKEFKQKRKSCQNHEGSCNSGYIFWNPKKLLLSSITKKYQLWALLESGIGRLNENCIDRNLIYVTLDLPLAWFGLNTHMKKAYWIWKLAKISLFWVKYVKTQKSTLKLQKSQIFKMDKIFK